MAKKRKNKFKVENISTAKYAYIQKFRGKYVMVKTLHGTFTGYLRVDDSCLKGEYRISNDVIKATDIVDIEEM